MAISFSLSGSRYAQHKSRADKPTGHPQCSRGNRQHGSARERSGRPVDLAARPASVRR